MPGRLRSRRASSIIALAMASMLVSAAAARAAPRPAPGAAVLAKAREHRVRHQHDILREFAELLRMPNVASDSVNIRRNADHLVAMLERRGVTARRLELPGSPPAVFGQLVTAGARRTVVLYAHYDGQPVTPRDWASDPWTPVLRDRPHDRGGREMPWPAEGPLDPEWRLYGRSAGDDKAPIIALLAALDALQAQGVKPSVSLKIFLEGEEEAGSTHLAAMLAAHRELLGADAWIFCDGPMHPSRRPQLVFGVRGVMGLELTVYGPARGLHSGHYGNWAPNPVARMAELLAGMRDGEGRILVRGFDREVRPVTAAEQAAIDATPDPDAALRDELRLGGVEGGDRARLAEAILRPAMNFRGIQGGGVGASAANAIPTEARASIDIRMVPDQTPAVVRAAVEDHLRERGWHVVTGPPDSATLRAHARVVRVEWSGGYAPYRVALDGAFPRAVAQSMEESLGRPILLTPTLGGSLPLAIFHEVLGAPIIVLPIANHDNNQHAANENLRLQNLWDGVDVMTGLLVRLGALWR